MYHIGSNLRIQLTEVEFREEHSHVLKTFDDVATLNEWTQWLQVRFFAALGVASTSRRHE